MAGLHILRENSLIHRDLKPQVWLILCLSYDFDAYVVIYIVVVSMRQEARPWQSLCFPPFVVITFLNNRILCCIKEK